MSQKVTNEPTRLVVIDQVSDKTLIRVGAGVIPVRRDGSILLERRRDCSLWGLVGGRVEPGETILEAALREAREETGLDLEYDHLLGVYSRPQGRILRFDPSGDERHIVDVVLVMKVISERKEILSSESLDLAWFNAKELPPRNDFLSAAWEPVQNFMLGFEGVIQ